MTKREKAAFIEACNSVNTQQLHDAICAISDLAALREDFENLIEKIEGLDGESSDDEGKTLFELAEEITMALGEPLETLHSTAESLDKIVLLDPGSEEHEAEDDSDEEAVE